MLILTSLLLLDLLLELRQETVTLLPEGGDFCLIVGRDILVGSPDLLQFFMETLVLVVFHLE